MISSNEVSQLFAAQNSMFMGQNSFAHQIGMTAPNLGAMGAPMPPGGGYNFGTPTMMGGGNRFASSMMSGFGAAASIGASFAFDPFSAAVGGFARGGLMGGVGAAAAPLAVGMLAAHTVQSVVHGGQQQQAVNSTLGSNYNFFNPASRTGMGFTRDDAAAIGNLTRQLSHVPEMMTSMGELTNIMGKLRSTGLMQGVKDASEFSQRFKEAIGTIRDTAKILGTTMDDAVQFFAHSRSVGFLGKNEQLKNALNVQLTSGLTGMTNGQVMGLQQTGANLATQIGARRSLGASAVTSIAQNIGVAQREGLLAPGLLEDITGMQGADAVNAASQRMAGLMVNMAGNSPAGQLIMAGLAKFDDRGRAVGLDEALVRQFNSGGLSISDLKARAGSLTDAQKISFRARQADLAASFAGQVGAGGMGRFIDEILGGARGSEAVNLLTQRYGATAGEADLMQQLRGVGSDIEFSQMTKIRGRETAIREATDPSTIFRRIGTKLHAGTFGHAEELGADIQKGLGEAYDEFIDDLVGRHVVSLSKGGAEAFRRAMSGGNKAELKAMFEAAHGIQPGGSLASSFRETNILAGLQSIGTNGTGRTTTGQLSHISKLLGGGDVMSKLSALNNLKGTDSIARAAEIIDSLKGEDFGQLNDAAKLDYLMNEVSKKTSGSGSRFGVGDSDLQRALSDAARMTPKGGNPMLTLIAAAQGGFRGRTDQIDFTKTANPVGAQDFLSTEAIAHMKREAVDNLNDMVGEGAAGLYMNNSKAKQVIDKALIDSNFAKIFSLRDDNEIIRQAGERGFMIKPEDLDAIKEAVKKFRGALGGEGEIFDVMGTLNTAIRAEGAQVIIEGIRDTGLEAVQGGRALGGALGKQLEEAGLAFSGISASGLTPDQRMKRLEAAKAKVMALAKTAMELSPEDQNRLIEHAGTMGASIAELSRVMSVQGKKFGSAEDLARELGLDPNDPAVMSMLKKAGATGTRGFTVGKKMIEALSENAAGLAFSRSVARDGQTAYGAARDDILLNTLTKMDKNQDLTASILMALVAKQGITAEDINKVQKEMRGKIAVSGEE